MKKRITKQEARETNKKIFAVGDCDLQYLFNYTAPYAYSTRREGWACDYYDLGGGVCIASGYDTFDFERLDYKLVKKYNEKAQSIYNSKKIKKEETKKKHIQKLIEELYDLIK